MRQVRSFLVIAEDPDRLMFISAVLHRKFPNALVQTCRDGDAGLEVMRRQKLDAVVALRSTDCDEVSLVRNLRQVAEVPILLLGGADQEKAAGSAGATGFLEREGWLMVGNTVAEMIGAKG